MTKTKRQQDPATIPDPRGTEAIHLEWTGAEALAIMARAGECGIGLSRGYVDPLADARRLLGLANGLENDVSRRLPDILAWLARALESVARDVIAAAGMTPDALAGAETPDPGEALTRYEGIGNTRATRPLWAYALKPGGCARYPTTAHGASASTERQWTAAAAIALVTRAGDGRTPVGCWPFLDPETQREPFEDQEDALDTALALQAIADALADTAPRAGEVMAGLAATIRAEVRRACHGTMPEPMPTADALAFYDEHRYITRECRYWPLGLRTAPISPYDEADALAIEKGLAAEPLGWYERDGKLAEATAQMMEQFEPKEGETMADAKTAPEGNEAARDGKAGQQQGKA